MALPLTALARLQPDVATRKETMGRNPRNIAVMPGIRAGDPAFRRMCFDLYKECERVAPRSQRVDGLFLAPGSTGNWTQLLHVAGRAMNPGGTPTGKQTADVVDHWLSKEDETIFTDIVRLLFPRWEAADFSSRREASTMYPFASKDPEIKLRSLLAGLEVTTNELERAVRDNTPERLFRDFDFIAVHEKASRLQPDSVTVEGKTFVPKPREVWDFFGKRVQSDKSLALPGVDVPHFAVRERIAYGTSASANYTLVLAAAMLRHIPYGPYGRTFHHGNGVMIERALDPRLGFPVPMDVKNFDQNQGPHFIAAFIDNLPISAALKTLSRLVAAAPVRVFNDYYGQKGHRWIGNPLDFRSYTLRHGNPSGWGWNDLLNQAVGTFICLKVGHAVGALARLDRDTIHQVLAWEHPSFAFQNKGDDSVLWFADRAKQQRAVRALSAGQDFYLRCELEDGARFLGNVFVRDRDHIRVLPDISSFLVRFLVPEYDWHAKERPFAAYGFFQRKAHYAVHPCYEALEGALNRVMTRHYGVSIDAYLREAVKEPDALELLNWAEVEFLTNPAAIHYKIDRSQLRNELQDKYFLSVPASTLTGRITPLMEKQ